MPMLRIGTRGSDLALWQAHYVKSRLGGDATLVIIESHADAAPNLPAESADWPVGGFTGTLELALARGEVDVAVHSHKDLPTAGSPGLVIAAVPERAAVHDLLISNQPLMLDALPPGLRIGTSSPRRTEQLKRLAPHVQPMPIRGNVPGRLRKMGEGQYDAIILAAAGVGRLGLQLPHALELPFITSPAQGALAVQCRTDDAATLARVRAIDDATIHRCVRAERSFLAAAQAGCRTPIAAQAAVSGTGLILTAELFEHGRWWSVVVMGEDPIALGVQALAELRAEMPS